MIYLFDKDEKLIKIVRKSAVKTALQKYALTTERYVSDRLTAELRGLNADELEQVEYMAIQTMEDAHIFHYFYVAQKSSDELTALIGVQSGIEELRKSPVYDKRPQNAFARDVITDLLAGTNWQARFVGETTAHSTNFYYTSVFDALKKVCEVWDLEMQFFVEMNGNRIGARYIDFKRRIGEAVGKRVVYGHNALQILQEVERTNICTALVGRGKGEETGDGYGRKITFEDAVWSRTQGKPVDKPKGQKYLELPLMTRQYGIKNADGSMRPKIGFVDFSEEENPDVLIERTYRALVDAARPQLTLKTSSVYLRGVKVGDTIRVVRHDKKLDYDTRIFEITFNRLNNQSSDIKLGDRIGESNEAKAQTIADKAVEQFVTNEFSNFIQNLPDYLPSADGFNNNWYGTEDPTVKYPGKVLINDIWFKPDPEHEGHKIMLRWTGEVWEEILRTYESEALRERIAEEIAQVNQSMQAQAQEHDRQVADILSKTQSVEEIANQAKSDAASAIDRANQVKTEAIADAQAQVELVSQALSTAKTDLQNQVNAIDAKAVKVQADANALRTDLNQQAQTILAQAQTQTALTNRVTSVETLADGTKTTVTELSKTVTKATGDIASVTSRTKTVEDTLSQTRTQYEALTQTVNAQTGQIDSINRKTADLQSGIDGVTERFENLKIGSRNYFKNSKSRKYYITNLATQDVRTYIDEEFWQNDTRFIKDYVRMSFDIAFNPALSSDFTTNVHFSTSPWYAGGSITFKGGTTELQHFDLKFNLSGATSAYKTDSIFIRLTNAIPLDTAVGLENFNLYLSAAIEDYSQSDVDFESKIAEYKRTADQNYAGLHSTVSTLDGKVTQNKTEVNQTTTQLSNRLTSVEAYKDGESTRAQAYFEASKTETAKQLTAERTSISANYVAKSVYDENVSGTTLKLNEIKTTADTTKQNLATYQETVDRKLTELTSSTQTLDGKINTASTKVDTVAGQIRTEIGTVEAKIPTEIGGRNYILKSQAEISSTGRWVSKPFNLSSDLLSNLSKIKTVTISCEVVGENVSVYNSRKRFGLSWSVEIDGIVNYWEVWQTEDTAKKRISQTFTVPDGKVITKLYSPTLWIQAGGDIKVSNPKIEFGRVPTDHTLAPEDVNDELSAVKTTINQTSQGVEQLSTSLSTTNDKVSTAETKINQLIGDVSSKVSQTDYNTLTGRVDSAETAITQNATEISKRLTKTEVDKAITDKGYQTKSDVDSNINGRGYITSSSLQPYALATTVQNLVKETADSFGRTISETKALIPTFVGGRNYLLNSNVGISGAWALKVISLSQELLNNLSKIKTVTISCEVVGENVSVYNSRKRFGLSWSVEIDGIVNYWEVWQTEDTAKKRISQTFTVPDGKVITKLYSPILWIQAGGNITVSNPKLEYGTLATDYTVALEDLATVTALHDVSDTVDSHTRTIGAVGTAGSILDNVSKVTQTAAGLVQEVSGDNGLKTQVSTLAGSYAIKSLTKAGDVLGQMNLNKDGSVKIDGSLVQITGKTYIENGVIKEAMIGKGQIGTAHIGEIDAGIAKIINLDVSNIKGLDAEFIKAKIENAFIEWMKGKTITAQNEAMTIGLNDAFIRFKDNAKIEFQSENNTLYRTKNGTSAFIHFRDDSYNGVYTAMGVNADNTGTQNDYSSGSFAGVRVIRSNPSRYSGTTVDQVQLVGDEIRIRHGYGYENDYLVIKWDNQGKIDLIKFLRSVASRLGLPLT